jgi:CHASE2 domain-containing sensor protein
MLVNGNTGRRRRIPSGLIVAAAVAIAVVLLLRAIPSLNPFATETIDRSQPAVLRSIEKLSEYRAATANLDVIVDVEEDAEYLPSFIKGTKVLFVAGGTVDAFVSFEAPQVRVDEDRRTATITLPPPRLSEAQIDLERSRVYDRDRGLFDRVESVFEDSPTSDQELIALAQEKLETAAAADRSLGTAAERNTRQMLEGLLTGLGFDAVTVRFAEPTPPS